MAQKRRQTRRKTTSRGGTKRPTKRKTAAQQHQYTGNVIGLILLLVCLLALLQAGIIGTLAANLIRFVVGDTYQFVGLIGGAVGLALLITGKLPTLKRHFIVGVGIAYVGLLLWLHTALFLAADQHTGFVSYTLQLLNSDIANGSVSQHIGGGMVGAVFLTITNFLVSLIGTQIIAVILMIVGVMVFFNIPMAVLFQGLSKGCHVFGRELRDWATVSLPGFSRSLPVSGNAQLRNRPNQNSRSQNRDNSQKQLPRVRHR